MCARSLRLASLLLTASLLCGCCIEEYVHNGFKVGPNYKRPPAPVAEDWIDAGDLRLRTDSPDLSKWWTVFSDPILDSLICNAYNQNLTLREAGFRVLEARAFLGETIGEFFPQTQNMTGDAERRAVSAAVANRQFIAERFYGQWDYGFNLAWELDFWGRFRRAIEAADADLNASIENYDDVLVTLLGDVATAYVQIRVLQQQIELVKTNIKLQQESLGIAEARFKGGQTTELDPDQAQSVLSQTEAIQPQLEIELRRAANRLCILMGMPPKDLLPRLGLGDIPITPTTAVVGIPAQLLTRRPDIRREERRAAAESARIGVAVSALFPHISLTGTLGWSAEEPKDLFTSQAFRGSIGPSFRWDILNYFRLVNNIRQHDARFQALVARYQNTVLQANEEVENGIVQFLKSQARVRFLGESVDAAVKSVKVAIAQYKAGTVDYNRVALLEQNLVQQQNLLVQARGDVALGLVNVYRALGGGWEIRCTGCDPHPPAPPVAPAPPVELLPPPQLPKETTKEEKPAPIFNNEWSNAIVPASHLVPSDPEPEPQMDRVSDENPKQTP